MPTTSPDGLAYPLDSYAPDVPKDIKALATTTQTALTARAAAASSALSSALTSHVNSATPHPNDPLFDNLGAEWKLLVHNTSKTISGSAGTVPPIDLSSSGTYIGSCPYIGVQPYSTTSRITFAVTNADVSSIQLHCQIDNAPAPVGSVVLIALLVVARHS